MSKAIGRGTKGSVGSGSRCTREGAEVPLFPLFGAHTRHHFVYFSLERFDTTMTCLESFGRRRFDGPDGVENILSERLNVTF